MAPLPSLSRSPPMMPLGSCSWVNAPWLLRACDWAAADWRSCCDNGSSASTLVAVGFGYFTEAAKAATTSSGLALRPAPSPTAAEPVGRRVEGVELGLREHRRDGGRLERCTGLAADEQHENGGAGLLQRRLREHLRRGVPTARDGEHLDARRRELGGGLLRGRATRQRLGVGVGRLERRPDEGLLPGSGPGRGGVERRRRHRTHRRGGRGLGGVGSDGRGLRGAGVAGAAGAGGEHGSTGERGGKSTSTGRGAGHGKAFQ